MHPQQKAAWFTLIVIGGTVVLYTAVVPTLSWWLHRALTDVASPALGLFGLVGLTGFGGLFLRKSDSKNVVMDERDHNLSRQAWGAGMRIFWLVFCTAGMGVWAYFYFLRGEEAITVPVVIFPMMLFAGFIVFSVAQSLATLHFYGWRAGDGR